MPLGLELREARDRAGLSIEQIAKRTRFELHEIVALESDSLTHVPDETYLEGLILSYAAEVGLDAAPVMERVRMERERYDRDWDVRREASDVSPESQPPPPEVPADPEVQGPESAADSTRPETGHSRPAAKDPQRGWLLLPLVSCLAVGGWAAYFIESGTFNRQAAAPAPSQLAESARPGPASTPSARVPVADAVNTATAAASVVSPARAVAPVPNDVSGRWSLETRVVSTRLKRFAGLQLGYQIDLTQKGTRVTGTGKKVSENGTPLAERAQTPVRVAGKITANKLILSFSERGRQRTTRGGLAMQLDETGALLGRFTSSAAQSSGTAEARRR